MKKILILLLLFIAILPAYSKKPFKKINTKSKKQIMLEKKLRDIKFKSINFQDANISDVFKFLRKTSKKYDPEGKGVNIITPGFKNNDTTVTLQLDNIPLSELLRYVCISANLQYKVEDFGVIIKPKKPSSNPKKKKTD